MQVTENERLKIARKNLNLTQAAIAERLGITQGGYADAERGKVKVSGNIKLGLNKEFSINPDWLETGIGSMFKSSETNRLLSEEETVYGKLVPNAKLIGDIYETEYEEGERFRPLGNGRFMMRVELVTEKAKAGWLRGFADPEYQEELKTIEVPVDFVAKGNYLSFDVEGDSMDDDSKRSIPDKSIAVGRELPQHQWMPRLYNHEWKNWIFVHKKDGVIIKQIADQNLDEGWIKYTCLNPNKELYPDKVIYLKDIYKIYNVVKTIISY